MIKKILFGILLISTMAFNVCATCDYHKDVSVGTYRCIGGVYISVGATGSDMADIHICEKGLHTECITSTNVFVDGIVYTYDEWIIDETQFLNHDSDMFINISDITSEYVRFRICDYGTGEPSPTPTPDPTPEPTPEPTGTPDGGGEYDLNESEDYGGSLDGTGAGGGQGGVYDSIGQGLGDGGSGNAAVSKSLFYTMIPVLFVIITIIFIGKLLGIDIGKLKR